MLPPLLPLMIFLNKQISPKYSSVGATVSGKLQRDFGALQLSAAVAPVTLTLSVLF